MFRVNIAVRFASGEMKGFTGTSEANEVEAYYSAVGLAQTTGREFVVVPVPELTAEELHSIRLDWAQSDLSGCF